MNKIFFLSITLMASLITKISAAVDLDQRAELVIEYSEGVQTGPDAGSAFKIVPKHFNTAFDAIWIDDDKLQFRTPDVRRTEIGSFEIADHKYKIVHFPWYADHHLALLLASRGRLSKVIIKDERIQTILFDKNNVLNILRPSYSVKLSQAEALLTEDQISQLEERAYRALYTSPDERSESDRWRALGFLLEDKQKPVLKTVLLVDILEML